MLLLQRRIPAYSAVIMFEPAAPLMLGTWVAPALRHFSAGLIVIRTAPEVLPLPAKLAG